MNQNPVAISLILCEQVIVDEKTHNATPVNCFNLREVNAFPGQTTFYALIWLTDGMGELKLEVLVERLDSLEEVFRLTRKLRFANPLNEMRCVVRINDCDVPVSGPYQVSLSIEGELIAHRKFAVKKKGE